MGPLNIYVITSVIVSQLHLLGKCTLSGERHGLNSRTHTWCSGPVRRCLELSLVQVLYSELFWQKKGNYIENINFDGTKDMTSGISPEPELWSPWPFSKPLASSTSSRWISCGGWIINSFWTSINVTSSAGPPLLLYCCFSFWMVPSVD